MDNNEKLCSTSLPGGNQVDGLPPASSLRYSWTSPCGRVTRRAYMPRMSMLARVIRWPGWASLNFCSSGHFVRNDHHIEKFEKFEHSGDFPIIF